MKYNLIYCCVVIICMAFIGCSDDSDKIDAFFKEKVAKFESTQPTAIAETCSNAVLFKSKNGFGNYYFLIDSNREKVLSEDADEIYWKFYYSEEEDYEKYYYYIIQDLEPGTTYYYRECLDSYTQINLSEGKALYSAIQSFTTPELTAGEISENYFSFGEVRVRINPSLYLDESSKVKVTVEYSLSSDLANSEHSYRSNWNDNNYYNYVTLYSLAPNTKYYYRLIVTINNKDFRSPISSFTTASK